MAKKYPGIKILRSLFPEYSYQLSVHFIFFFRFFSRLFLFLYVVSAFISKILKEDVIISNKDTVKETSQKIRVALLWYKIYIDKFLL